MLYEYHFNQEKNLKIKKERGISFEEIIYLIESGKLLNTFDHPNIDGYPNQKIFAIDVEGYVWLVPFVIENRDIFLKTAFPSRKASKDCTEYMEKNNGK